LKKYELNESLSEDELIRNLKVNCKNMMRKQIMKQFKRNL
jgi:hypothetical protein